MITLAELRAAVTDPHPAALEELARRELNAGTPRERLSDAIADLLPALRQSPDYADAWEDRVVDLVDRLTGWTHPSAQLFPSPPAPASPDRPTDAGVANTPR